MVADGRQNFPGLLSSLITDQLRNTNGLKNNTTKGGGQNTSDLNHKTGEYIASDRKSEQRLWTMKVIVYTGCSHGCWRFSWTCPVIAD